MNAGASTVELGSVDYSTIATQVASSESVHAVGSTSSFVTSTLAITSDMAPLSRRSRIAPDYVTVPARVRPRSILRRIALNLAWCGLGLGVVVAAWALGSLRVAELPSPLATWTELVRLMSDPFRNAGPNDQGVLMQLGASLLRVAKGFTVAVIVGVPFGLLIGGLSRRWHGSRSGSSPSRTLPRPPS
jgi:hypothetical protein